MDILERTASQLKTVTTLQKRLQVDKKRIQEMQYRRFGMNLMTADEEWKQMKIQKAIRDCNAVCSKIYDQLNRERLQAGLPELENPYK